MKKTFYFLLILLFTTVAAAQDECPELVTEALDSADELCADLDRNEACYGNFQIDADVQDGEFAEAGDITDLININRLDLAGLNEEAGTWGVAVMNLQADIPDTLPGQNVTFLLFGDVEIESAVNEDDDTMTPMQAFYLTTGVTGTSCDDAPDGLLVQTPDGVAEVSLNVNGADVTLGSTAFIQTIDSDDVYASEGDTDLAVSVLEGQGTISVDGETEPIPAGSWIRLSLGENRLAQRLTEAALPYENARFERLPIQRLQRQFDLTPSLTQERINEIRDEFRANGGFQQLFEGEVNVSITNSTDTSVNILIGDVAAYRIAPGLRDAATFSAGRYTVTVCGGPERCFSFEHVFIRDQNHVVTPQSFRKRGL
ncbi:MAG: hypothetical protein ACPG7F_08195 [Aggregatilineales bacterium]